MAKPMKIRDFSTRPVWQEDAWLTKHAGETLGVRKDGEGENGDDSKEEEKDAQIAVQMVKAHLSRQAGRPHPLNQLFIISTFGNLRIFLLGTRAQPTST